MENTTAVFKQCGSMTNCKAIKKKKLESGDIGTTFKYGKIEM